MTEDTTKADAGRDWAAFVRKSGTPEFDSAFAPDARLLASVLKGPCSGATAIGAFFAATTGGMYETIAFTSAVVAGAKTFLEWEGRAFGLEVGGVTIVERDGDGLIRTVSLYHRPFEVIGLFGEELGRRLEGKIDGSLLIAKQ